MYNSYERYVTTTCADEYGVSAHIDQTTGSMCTCSTRVRVWEKREPSIWRYNHMPPCSIDLWTKLIMIQTCSF
ncbi:unnamed protein product [Brassica oleracea var. botrytis]|uniref:(rape) hypothetical protein n=1 Tax=Brassica napus TaxID=3708 RepID=A0A816JTN0_BRANA|nr:unnamed protein product [Brassica napus]